MLWALSEVPAVLRWRLEDRPHRTSGSSLLTRSLRSCNFAQPLLGRLSETITGLRSLIIATNTTKCCCAEKSCLGPATSRALRHQGDSAGEHQRRVANLEPGHRLVTGRVALHTFWSTGRIVISDIYTYMCFTRKPSCGVLLTPGLASRGPHTKLAPRLGILQGFFASLL